jgi:pimeloyl-ACP methyl ester carboxylesterase
MMRMTLRAACALFALAMPVVAASADPSGPAPEERRSYVDTRLGQVHVRRIADARQGTAAPILLIHQTPWYALEYSRVTPLLAAAGHVVLAPATPGVGFSPAPSGQPDLPAYADALAEVLGALDVPRAIIVGHHTGAALAALLAARHPERAQCVVLHGMPLYTDAERAEKLAALASQGDPVLSADGTHLSRHFVAIRERIMGGKGSLEGVQASTVSWLIASDRSMRAYRALFEFPAMETTLRRIDAPTLLMVDRDDRLLAATRKASRLRGHFVYRELPGGGSHVIFDHPEEWVAMLQGFIEQQCAQR